MAIMILDIFLATFLVLLLMLFEVEKILRITIVFGNARCSGVICIIYNLNT
jgi:hypothetical protein